MQNSTHAKSLNLKRGTDLLFVLIKDRSNALNLNKMPKNWSLKETTPSYDQTFASLDNPEQNIWKKMEKPSKIGQSKKRLISSFACF